MQNTCEEVQAILNVSMEEGVGPEIPPVANEQQKVAERSQFSLSM